ncbi:MAG: hypothetical protein GX575_04270 [Candidatus Anammoximicrobium sp.]|nr:hypothetical protein [Candidatus Anammoximicrobium sp.]
MRITWSPVVLLSLVLLSVAAAQYPPLPPPSRPLWPYPPFSYHASTYEEGVQRGFADIIRSAGAANLMNSKAAKNYEDARRKCIDNRVYGAEKYFQMRQMNRAARAEERGRQPTTEDLIRYASQRAPDRLSPSALDPLTGAVNWPALLRDTAYEPDRQKLEQLYAARSTTGFLTAEQVAVASAAIDRISAQLKRRINDFSPQLYAESKDFLKSLAYEATQPSE